MVAGSLGLFLSVGCGSDGSPEKTYAQYDECFCQLQHDKFWCKDLDQNTSYTPVDAAPTCTCNGYEAECKDLHYDLPGSIWLTINCSGNSTMGTPSFELWTDTLQDVPASKVATLTCGENVNLVKADHYYVDLDEGSTSVGTYDVPSGDGPLVLEVTLQ